MANEYVGQKVECDQCTWSGREAELEQVQDGRNQWYLCPECGEESISYMGHE